MNKTTLHPSRVDVRVYLWHVELTDTSFPSHLIIAAMQTQLKVSSSMWKAMSLIKMWIKIQICDPRKCIVGDGFGFFFSFPGCFTSLWQRFIIESVTNRWMKHENTPSSLLTILEVIRDQITVMKRPQTPLVKTANELSSSVFQHLCLVFFFIYLLLNSITSCVNLALTKRAP